MSNLDFANALTAWRQGDRQALDQLFETVYAELRALASRQVASESSRTLSATALVNEAYLRLVKREVACEDRAHFLAVTSRLMRRILVDFARSRGREKRGGALPLLPIDTAALGLAAPSLDVLDIHDALDRLSVLDSRKAEAVELSFFGGLTNEEIAQALGVSINTVGRDLQFAKAWLRRELSS
ncbi:MAG: sigma-70 family RNA polymerase sigma factor [Bryobacterales bacterium]|nr:sigma-70 family RNA polymerase sigma factor [Bryobacterales bacterium]